MEAKKRSHAPFVLYRPWSFANDQHYVLYYPEGMYQRPQKYGPLSWAEAAALLAEYPGDMDLEISMGECTEWLFVLHHFSEHSKLYTEEQLDRFKKKELQDNPELSYLVTDDGDEMRRLMLRLPQVMMSRMDIMQQAIMD